MNNMFEGKTILITGGTWFLWRALTKRILELNPHSIRIYSRDEVKHFMMQEEFHNNEKLRFLIGDIRDYERLEKALKWVDYVINAAALKRLDLIEYNTEEAIKTNILWTLNLVRACENNHVKKVVFVSTDKACSPINTYGACKFVSERIMTESNYSNGQSGTVYTCVRYGNVINSTWSIVPILLNKIKNNEPFTLTDDTMTRFLITEDEAVQLILNAFIYGIGGEVFIPILPSVKIVDLMTAIKKVNNYNKDIVNIWSRPGEKIHELMINESEGSRIIKLENMYVIKSMIQTYKEDAKQTYEDKHEEIVGWMYSSANSLLTVDQIIERFKKYLSMKEQAASTSWGGYSWMNKLLTVSQTIKEDLSVKITEKWSLTENNI
jgi:UDP-N-acetylglucosamine 4,6-dehydratase/5-epimerase